MELDDIVVKNLTDRNAPIDRLTLLPLLEAIMGNYEQNLGEKDNVFIFIF